MLLVLLILVTNAQKVVSIFGEKIPVRASVHTFGGLSGHAGQTDLLRWLESFAGSGPRVFLTHGEERGRKPLGKLIEERCKLRVDYPGLHETIEITHGFTDWFETGFYIFTSAQNGDGWDWVGDHIRPRVRIPKKWNWPVGLSLSNEIGYQRRKFSTDTWTWEMRPIIDKQAGRWYFSFNPTFDKSLHGESVNQGFVFSPNAKISYDFTKKITGGIEYYGSLGPATDFSPFSQQQQQIFPAIDLNLSPKWEINFGVGVGVTRSTDHLIAKTIIGYRFDF